MMVAITRVVIYFSGHCKTLAPEYAKAAQRLAQNTPPYYIAKVDATENKEAAEKFGIKGFPTLLFFKYVYLLYKKLESGLSMYLIKS